MHRNSARTAARQAVIAGALCAAMSSACKSREPAPTIPHRAPVQAPAETSAAPRPEPPTFHVRPEPTFELPDDLPADPAEELRAMRHNCCDEMPASEIETAIRAEEPSAATTLPPPAKANRRAKNADRSR
jgi:hypothetical protein